MPPQEKELDFDAEIPIHPDPEFIDEQTSLLTTKKNLLLQQQPEVVDYGTIPLDSRQRREIEEEVINVIMRRMPNDEQVIDEFTSEIPGRKNKRQARKVLKRLCTHLENYAKLIDRQGESMSEQTKKVNIDILENDLRALWYILFNCGLFLGLMLLFFGIPGLVVLLVAVIAGIAGELTSRQQAYIIIHQILPLTRLIIKGLSGSTTAPIKLTARSIKRWIKRDD